jgi:hypothetical protein
MVLLARVSGGLKFIAMDAQGVLGEHGFPFFCSDNA